MPFEVLKKLSTKENLENLVESNEIKDDVGTTNSHCSVYKNKFVRKNISLQPSYYVIYVKQV